MTDSPVRPTFRSGVQKGQRTRMRLAATTSLAVLLTATAAFAQDELARRQAVEVAARVPLEKAITGAPYSAETLVEGVQTLADGNRIVRKTTGRVYRDHEGRTRREEDNQAVTAVKNPATGEVSTNRRTMISIADPVAGFSYSLDPERKIAWRTAMGTSAAIMNKLDAAKVEQLRTELEMKVELEKRAARTAGATDKPSADAADEQKVEAQKRAAAGGGGRGGALGPAGAETRMRGNATAYAFAANPGPLERKTLEGVTVEGRKTTTTIPAGQVGNEQPLTITSEEWRSPELNVLVMTHHSDPRTGESSYRLTNIVRAEPDPSFFMVPPDYEIRDSGIRKMLEAKK